jgi:tRNA threonylcarbamoyladenosine dehydratase
MDDRFSREVIFSRMLGIVTEQELRGGVGFTHAETLVRMGVGAANIADFDAFGPENFNRQFGATVKTVGQPKTSVLHERLTSINPALRVRVFANGVQPDNVAEFLNRTEVVCDAIDYFVMKPRLLLYQEAKSRQIPVAIAAPVGFGASLHVFDPNGMSFTEYFDITDGQSDDEKLRNFGVGLNPAGLYRHYMSEPKLDFAAKTVSSMSCSCLLASSMMGAFAISRLLNKYVYFKAIPYVYQVDLAAGKFIEHFVPDGVKGIRANPRKYQA